MKQYFESLWCLVTLIGEWAANKVVATYKWCHKFSEDALKRSLSEGCTIPSMENIPPPPPFKPARISPKKGEIWYAKRPDARVLSKVLVTDVTAKTVEVASLDGTRRSIYNDRLFSATRYINYDIRFIEKIGESGE